MLGLFYEKLDYIFNFKSCMTIDIILCTDLHAVLLLYITDI